jgi:gluconate 5-dehydrogenase
MSPLFDLTGKTALVTGSSQGIGLALAKGLAESGASVLLNGRNAERLADASTSMPGSVGLSFDVTDAEAVKQAVDGYEANCGPIDVLVNNAGMQLRGPLEAYDPADFDRLMRTNVNSAFYVGQAVAKHMISRGAGKIINIASVQTALARPGIAPYTASKGAVGNLTKGMATDWARYGLQVNAIAPGYFKTPLNETLYTDADFSAWLETRTPAGRWGEVDELQGACIFLASSASSFVNGQTLFVDGGISVSL